MIAVNVSPIDWGHVLLVPEPTSCLPQVSGHYISLVLPLYILGSILPSTCSVVLTEPCNRYSFTCITHVHV